MKRRKFIPLVVVAAGLLAYHNSFTGPFIFDDAMSIQENATIRHLWPIWQTLSPPHTGGATVEGRPLINLSFAINYALGGYHVWGYHALNLTIHILAALTLFGIVRRTLRQPRFNGRFDTTADELALAVAVLWVVHPLQTESVTYIVQRAESLMGLFYLLTLYCFIRAVESPRPREWYGLCVGACVLGMASKEVMASAPLLVMLYDRTFVSGSFREAWRRRWKLYVMLAGTWMLLGYLMFFTGSYSNAVANARLQAVSRWPYLLTEPGVVTHYLRLTVWPDSLCLDYYGWPMAQTWTSILPPALVMAILLGATVWAWRTNSAWGVVGAWFFLILAPTSSFIPTDSPAYEHRMYLPLAAVIVAGVMGIHEWAGRRTLLVVMALAVGLGVLTVRRNEDYRSNMTIWSDTVAKWPQNARAHNRLGAELGLAGRVSEAIAHCEEAVRLKPDYADARFNLANALSQAGRTEEAIGQYELALRLDPGRAWAHFNLAVGLAGAGRASEAIEQYEQAIRLKSDYADAHNNLGVILTKSGKVPEAITHYEQALRIRPEFAMAHYDLGVALAELGRMPEAMGHWEQALRINPDYVEPHYALGLAVGASRQTRGGHRALSRGVADQAGFHRGANRAHATASRPVARGASQHGCSVCLL
jgi:Flp pilus assembly protein TadD